VTQRVAQALQRLRRDLDTVILTRLPQFRDVVEDYTEPNSTDGHHDTAPPPALPSQGEPPARPLPDRHQEAARAIDQCSWLAAANALNPIPGLDIQIDLSIFAHMTRTVGAAYDLSEEQIAALPFNSPARLRSNSDTVPHLARCLTPYLACTATTLALRRIGLDLLAREATKWVPAVGSVIAACIGYRMIYHAGEQLRKECDAAAGASPSCSQAPKLAGTPTTND
jgi:hypothetical protein